jgi:hypothetical protein
MKKTIQSFFILLFVAAMLLSYRVVNRRNGEDYVLFKNLRLIDGNGVAATERTDILVQGERIAIIAPGQSVADAVVVDLKGKTLMLH